jgi:3-methyladenine DNA glycosylase AlkC
MFLPDYIEQYGRGHLKESLDAMEVITKLCSCEFAIRPFIAAHTDDVLKQMLLWTTHTHPSVRRLASEGCRSRLPWGMALAAFKKDPAPLLPILERLKNDDSVFVRKSVANNLNDIAKDNPDLMLAIAERWMGESKHTDWIVKHACRTLLKKADTRALSLFGLSATPACTVDSLQLTSESIAIGDSLNFSFSLTNDDKENKVFRVEYVISYVKANQKQSKKVFKITENTYHPGASVRFRRKQSFADMTTRKHYAGIHRLAIAVNGVEKAGIDFEVIG